MEASSLTSEEWYPLARKELVAGRKVIVAPHDILSEALRSSKLLQKARDEGSLRTLVGLFAGQSATVIEAPPTSDIHLNMDGMCKIRTSVGTTASLPIGSIGIDPEAEKQMRLKYEQNAVHDMAASEVQDTWRKAALRRKALTKVRALREQRELMLIEQRAKELSRQEMMVQNMAATSIQAAIRGKVVRQRMKPVPPPKFFHHASLNGELTRAEVAATTLESTFRGALQRKHDFEQQQDYMQHDDENDNTSDVSTKFLNACTSGDLHRVHTLHRDKGVNIHVADTKGNSGLLCACPGGHTDVVKFLVSVGGSLSMKNFSGWTPLHRACFYGRDELAEYIIDKLARQGARENPLSVTNHLGATPLHVAIPNGHKSLCDMLILRGAPLEAKNASGDTPLSFAVVCRKPELVALLIQSGADVNTRNNEGLAPYEIADKLGLPEISKLLSPSAGLLRADMSNKQGNSKWATGSPKKGKEAPRYAQAKKKFGKGINTTGASGSRDMFRPLNVPDSAASNSNISPSESKALKEDTKAVDGLLQNSSAVWSRRELVRRAWLNSCPLCDVIKMRLHEVHTILHVLGVLDFPPNKSANQNPADVSNSTVEIRLDTAENTRKDLSSTAEQLKFPSNSITDAHATKARTKLLSLIRCPKGATVLIAERKKAAEMGESTGKCLLQRLDIPEQTIDDMKTSGRDIVGINEKTLENNPSLKVLPSVIKYRLLFHCELLRGLAKLERESTKLKSNKKKRNDTEGGNRNRRGVDDFIDPVIQYDLDKNSLGRDSNAIKRDISIHSDLFNYDEEDGGWVTLDNFQEVVAKKESGVSNIQVAHFEELVSNMTGGIAGVSLSAEDLKIARRAASSRGKLLQIENDEKVVVELEDGLKTALPMQSVYIIPQVLTPAQLYVGANARVVKHGWLRQLFHKKRTDPAVSSDSSNDDGDNRDAALAERLGGTLVVVKEVMPERKESVKVQTADGFEASLPINSLCPPPIDAALKLLFRNSVSSGNSFENGPNFDAPKPRPSHKPPKSTKVSSSNHQGRSKQANHAEVNLNSADNNKRSQKSSTTRPLYREEVDHHGDETARDEMLMQQRRLNPTKINNNPYVPERMLRDTRVADQLGRDSGKRGRGGGGGGGGSNGFSGGVGGTRPKTAQARFGSTTQTQKGTGRFNETEDDLSSGNSQQYHRRSGKQSSKNIGKEAGAQTSQQRPKSAQPHGRQSSWTPLNVQTFDFKPATAKKEKKKDKPDFKFGTGSGARKSVDLRTNSDLPSTNASHTRSQISSPRENISPLKGKTTRRFDETNYDYEDNDGEHVYNPLPRRDYVKEPPSRKAASSARGVRPASASGLGHRDKSGAYANATWSFGKNLPSNDGPSSFSREAGGRGNMAETLRSTVTRQQQHAANLELERMDSPDNFDDFVAEEDFDRIGLGNSERVGGGFQDVVDDQDIRNHVEQLIDEQSGRWTGNGGLDSPSKRMAQHYQEMEASHDFSDSADAIFREQLDRMEEQMARKERQIKEVLQRQKHATEMNKESMKRSQRERSRQSKKLEQSHRQRREDLFRTDIAAEVDERIMNDEQTWREAEYAASEMAFAMDSLSESLNREKGRELEIRRKLKSLSKKQHRMEAILGEVHASMGKIKMSRVDGVSQVAALESQVETLMKEHEVQGKELRSQQAKLDNLRNNAEAAEAGMSLKDIHELDRDARLIHSIELKSSLLRNRRKELLESVKEVDQIIKGELRRYADNTSQLTIADVAIKAMKSVVGNFAATSNSL